MFRVPFPPKNIKNKIPIKKVRLPIDHNFAVSSNLLYETQGKIRTLRRKLLRYPRAKMRELAPYISKLQTALEAIIHFCERPKDVVNEWKVQTKLDSIARIEDMLIRVIVRGETKADVIRMQMANRSPEVWGTQVVITSSSSSPIPLYPRRRRRRRKMFVCPALPSKKVKKINKVKKQTKKVHKLITKQVVEDMKGKQAGLKRILKNPRANIPELKPYIAKLKKTTKDIIECREKPKNKISERKLKKTLDQMTKTEELLIRVIVKGESLEDVRKSQADEKERSAEARENRVENPAEQPTTSD